MNFFYSPLCGKILAIRTISSSGYLPALLPARNASRIDAGGRKALQAGSASWMILGKWLPTRARFSQGLHPCLKVSLSGAGSSRAF